MDLQEKCRLAQLPTELLLDITHWLTTAEYSAARQTCKLIERKTFDHWAHEFFHRKQFMVSTVSLTALLGISQHPELSTRLHHLIVSADTASGNPIEVVQRSPAQQQVFLEAFHDQCWLLGPGAWVSMLADAMARLTNLDTLDIHGSAGSPARLRDGPDARWRSYGASTYYRETGIELGDLCDAFERLYQGTLLAVAMSGITPPKFTVILHGVVWSPSWHIPDNVLARLRPFFANLRVFRIDGGTDEDVLPDLQKLISLATNVVELRVNVLIHDTNPPDAHLYWTGTNMPVSSPRSEQFWRWFSEPSTAENYDVPPPCLPHLESLEIGLSSVTPGDLVAIATKYPLRTLWLRKTALTYERSRGGGERVNLWSSLLRSLTRTEIRKLTISHCSQYGQPPPGAPSQQTMARVRFGHCPDVLLRRTTATWEVFTRAAGDVQVEDGEDIMRV